ncbi:MAG: four helix bundle protein [Bacteroidales bacterium]|nr:four helix bundle protein [Bacteroidales bacterium]
MNESNVNVSFFRFEDLRIYAKAMDYITWLYSEIEMMTDGSAVNVLKESFLKSAQNIALNTAEGSSRSKTQFLYYLKMAKSSVRECVVYTEIMSRKHLMGEESVNYSRNQLMELTKMIGSLIASLQRSAGALGREDKDDDPFVPMGDISNF